VSPLLAALLPALLLACAPGAQTGASTQSPIDLHLVVHIDPLPRHGDQPCSDDRLQSCGGFSAVPWRERIDNLRWLSDRWVLRHRAMDLEWGPEMAHILTEDPAHLASLQESYASDAHVADPAQAVADGVAAGQAAVQQAVDAGVASFGMHVHTAAPDLSGLWGTGPLAGPDGPHPCDAYAGDPLAEAPLDITESIIAYGADGAQAMADQFGTPIRAFTGSVPRVLGNKAQVLTDLDALDPGTHHEVPAGFAPWMLGGAYSECMIRAVDHPPFELYHTDPERSLGGGDGPLAHPAEPVVGNMADHLDMPADEAPGAVMRRILTAMLSWRYAALTQAPDRPWAYAFHTHLFHLYPGPVPAWDPNARGDVSAVEGGHFRDDAEEAAAFVDRFAGGGAWQGVSNTEGGAPLRWALPGDRDPGAADFVYGQADQAPPADMDDSYPYLPLVAETLAHSHLVCSGRLQEVEVEGLLRCEGGWAWGGDAAGFHCADSAEQAAWIFVLVPASPTCLQGVEGGLRAASVADEALGEPSWCEGGLEVPVEGLLVEPLDGPGTLGAACTADPAAGG